MYEDILDRGIKRTIISFDPFLKRDDVKGLTDAQVGRRFRFGDLYGKSNASAPGRPL